MTMQKPDREPDYEPDNVDRFNEAYDLTLSLLQAILDQFPEPDLIGPSIDALESLLPITDGDEYRKGLKRAAASVDEVSRVLREHEDTTDLVQTCAHAARFVVQTAIEIFDRAES